MRRSLTSMLKGPRSVALMGQHQPRRPESSVAPTVIDYVRVAMLAVNVGVTRRLIPGEGNATSTEVECMTGPNWQNLRHVVKNSPARLGVVMIVGLAAAFGSAMGVTSALAGHPT